MAESAHTTDNRPEPTLIGRPPHFDKSRDDRDVAACLRVLRSMDEPDRGLARRGLLLSRAIARIKAGRAL